MGENSDKKEEGSLTEAEVEYFVNLLTTPVSCARTYDGGDFGPRYGKAMSEEKKRFYGSLLDYL